MRRFLAGYLFILLLAGLFFYQVPLSFAQDVGTEIGTQLGRAGGATGANMPAPVDPRYTAARLIRLALGLVSIILLALILYAGFLWMTAGGNDEQITQARSYIKNSVIGLVIIILAYSITIAIFNLARGLPLSTSQWIF